MQIVLLQFARGRGFFWLCFFSPALVVRIAKPQEKDGNYLQRRVCPILPSSSSFRICRARERLDL